MFKVTLTKDYGKGLERIVSEAVYEKIAKLANTEKLCSRCFKRIEVEAYSTVCVSCVLKESPHLAFLKRDEEKVYFRNKVNGWIYSSSTKYSEKPAKDEKYTIRYEAFEFPEQCEDGRRYHAMYFHADPIDDKVVEFVAYSNEYKYDERSGGKYVNHRHEYLLFRGGLFVRVNNRLKIMQELRKEAARKALDRTDEEIKKMMWPNESNIFHYLLQSNLDALKTAYKVA